MQQQEHPMGLFSKDIKSLYDLFSHGLQDMYYAEQQILKSLPSMIDKASNADLKQGLEQHRQETEQQVRRLEQVFELDNEQPHGTKCPAIDGILKEGNDLMGEVEGEDVLDAGIIAAAQAVEHYEITRYGALVAWAKELGRSRHAAILARTLDEEKAADRKLTWLSERRVNPNAREAGEEGEKPAPRRSATRKRAGSARKSAGRKTAAKRAAAARRSGAGRKTSAKKRSASKTTGRRKTTRRRG
jgi:ferritin-like metal-binding protein YciE